LGSDPRAAALAAEVRDVLTAANAIELRPWAEQEVVT
jgi:hypothetical protein